MYIEQLWLEECLCKSLVELKSELRCSAILVDIDTNSRALLEVGALDLDISRCTTKIKLFLLKIGCDETDIDLAIKNAIKVYKEKGG